MEARGEGLGGDREGDYGEGVRVDDRAGGRVSFVDLGVDEALREACCEVNYPLFLSPAFLPFYSFIHLFIIII